MIRQGLLFVAAYLLCATLVKAEDFDANKHARDSMFLTLEHHHSIPVGTATNAGAKRHAAYLMLIKNALSLYRDGALSDDDLVVIRRLVAANLDYISRALAESGKWKQANRDFLRQMHHNSLAADQLVGMERANPAFAGLMDAYHSGIGYSTYQAAQNYGIEQHWIAAPY